jgi:hypothetical protein
MDTDDLLTFVEVADAQGVSAAGCDARSAASGDPTTEDDAHELEPST